MDSVDKALKDCRERMDKAVSYLQEEFSGLRTGKASPSLVENINVDYYGTPTRLKDIASISTPEPRLLVINPFDPSSGGAIEKAIQEANIGITPVNDGKVIRIPIPELSEERRQELTKVARRMAEEQRVAVRNVRRETNDALKKLEKDSTITEDDHKEATEDVQKLTDKHIQQIDELVEQKENEMLDV